MMNVARFFFALKSNQIIKSNTSNTSNQIKLNIFKAMSQNIINDRGQINTGMTIATCT